MLPTREQVEEKLNSLGYECWDYFYRQAFGWYKIYENAERHYFLRLHYVELPEAWLTPHFVLSFIDGPTSCGPGDLFRMHSVGLETLRIDSSEDLQKIEAFIEEYHFFMGFLAPWYVKGTKYEPEFLQWKKITDSFNKGYDKITNVKKWDEWRNKLSLGDK